MKKTVKHISLLLSLLLLASALFACGAKSDIQADDAHDSNLVGYWISVKQTVVEGTTTTEEDVAGKIGIEVYENGMIRIMARDVDVKTDLYSYSVDERYPDYMIIAKGQLAFLSRANNGEMYIDDIMEYTVKDGILTLALYMPNGGTTVTFKRQETPFYKYFPKADENSPQEAVDSQISASDYAAVDDGKLVFYSDCKSEEK